MLRDPIVFSKEVYEEMLDVLGHKGNAIQNTLRFYLTPVEIAIINNSKKKQQTLANKDVGKKRNTSTLLWECKLVQL
jgi:hypothetical protein